MRWFPAGRRRSAGAVRRAARAWLRGLIGPDLGRAGRVLRVAARYSAPAAFQPWCGGVVSFAGQGNRQGERVAKRPCSGSRDLAAREGGRLEAGGVRKGSWWPEGMPVMKPSLMVLRRGLWTGRALRSTKEEKVIFFECLSSMKVPSGFSSNIKGIINMAEKKFQNLKSHDCHVIMTQLLPIALRGLLPENVRVAIVKLCAFLNAISRKVINPGSTTVTERCGPMSCRFELVFPPSFFDIMTHLLVHLVEEISILGPVFLHNMFPFERFMGVLKKYVRNRARPEGSITKGYGNEEVIEFCVDFVPDLKPIGLPRSRHEGRLSGKGTIGRKSTICMDGHSLTEAHHTVLTNSSLVAPYFEKHKNILRSDNPGKPESWIRKAHMETFGGWLRKHFMSDNEVVDQLYMLAKTPSSTITTFQGYEINGNTFYTIAQDKKSTNQNSGVRFDAATENGQKVTYYGYIEEIWELDYGPSFKVPLFRANGSS
ncbi:hypothetical protein QYE76_046573 [Lolium multiflorum]|uniref:DUF4218 domain-containing protein n=1 Tax=Lolium multiflorum TaxID=4521 RepID=A0AAD8WYS2_LOLMU|nr:hypothetical protein QYE76_046573 [Lolium multiflorum]